MKPLTLVYGGIGQPSAAELDRREAADEWPRVRLYETSLNSDMLDERDIASVTGPKGQLYRRLPSGVAQAVEGFLRRRHYDVIVSWGEIFAMPLAAMLKATNSRTPHVGLFSWISRPKKAAVLRRVHSHIHRIVVWSSIQYDFAINELGIHPDRVIQLRWLVDQKFWRPFDTPTDMICAVGREMRDYSTLLTAMQDLNIPCHIAAKVDVGKIDQWMTDLRDPTKLPSHITTGSKPYPELRALYARSRFVVLPLNPTDTDNGVTAMTEAMAMGKAVICSRVEGQRDVLVDGVNGIFVPPKDPRALKAAIEHLWNNPEKCLEMGREGRKRIERFHTLEGFIAGVRRAAEEAIDEARRRT